VTGAAAVERDLLVVACAISAGIHAALVRGHLDESAAAGAAFAVSALVLAGLAVVLTRSPSPTMVAATAAVLAGLLAAYVLALTSGIPLVHSDPEPVTGLGLFTKAVEALGLTAALRLLRPRGAFA
jgi:hypothetical protein